MELREVIMMAKTNGLKDDALLAPVRSAAESAQNYSLIVIFYLQNST